MKPTPAHPEANPGYPDAKEFVQQHKAMLGALLLGGGLALGGCDKFSGRTSGVPTNPNQPSPTVRPQGSIPASPKPQPDPSGDPPRLPGDISVEPKIEQPPLGGVPPVVPQPEKSRD